MNPITEIRELAEAFHKLKDDVDFLKDIIHAVVKVVAEHEAKKAAG